MTNQNHISLTKTAVSLQKDTVSKSLNMVGEEIDHELGAKMVKDFQDANPGDNTANYIGRNILENILAQPDCEGIRFYNAINEMGMKTLVYVGVDSSENIITEYVGVNTSGELVRSKGIVADRAGRPPQTDDSESQTYQTDWNWWM